MLSNGLNSKTFKNICSPKLKANVNRYKLIYIVTSKARVTFFQNYINRKRSKNEKKFIANSFFKKIQKL